jgi:hypothetical protein
MKPAKILFLALLAYVALVTVFESLIGVMQPAGGGTLVITTFDADGTANDRVVSRLDSGGKLYVAANHWPRAWYRRALANPDVRATIDGEQRDYRAVLAEGAEHDAVSADKPLGFAFRVLTGFPPRHFLRLDPR